MESNNKINKKSIKKNFYEKKKNQNLSLKKILKRKKK